MAKKEKKEQEVEYTGVKQGTTKTWNKIFQTYIESANGEHYLVELQQNVETKDIRAMRV